MEEEGGGEEEDGDGPTAAFSSSVSVLIILTFRFKVSEESFVCSKKGASTHHFIRGANGGTAVIGRDTPGRELVRGTRAKCGGRPGVPFSHHTIVLTRASGGRSHISPLPILA